MDNGEWTHFIVEVKVSKTNVKDTIIKTKERNNRLTQAICDAIKTLDIIILWKYKSSLNYIFLTRISLL